MRGTLHRGRRGRRLRRAALAVTALALVAAGAGSWIYHARRPETRHPGEDLPEITRRLASDLPAEAPEPRWTDVTDEAGLGAFRLFTGARTSQLPEDMGAGAAWGDFDGDGDDDLFLVGAGGSMDASPATWAPSELFENRGDGAFRRVESFPETHLVGMGAAWGDVDGDGRLDLAVSGFGAILLFRNRGDRFELDTSLDRVGYWSGISWVDFDNDGDLDLYVCGYVRYDPARGGSGRASDQYGTAVPYTLNPASFEPERNLLFENDGRGGFAEVALLHGVANPEGRSLGALWHDFDDDGRLDLYVANDISDNALYLNRAEGFEDAGLAAWVADYRGAMGLAAGDWNGDGDDDLFVTHWIAQENALYDSRLAGGVAGRLAFSDVAAPAGLGQIALQAIGWGTEFADLDADGWLDLVVANGSTFETDDRPPRLQPQRAFLFWNRAGKAFHDLAPLSEAWREPRVGRGLALSDYDGDGDVDVLLTTLDSGVRLLRNDMQVGHWLEIELLARTPGGAARPADGTTVLAQVGGRVLRRSMTGASYLSQSSRVIHLGLGAASRVDGIEVRWHAGQAQTFGPLEAGARWRLVEGEPEPSRSASEGGGERQRVMRFWELQRAAMDAMKRRGDPAAAVDLFRQALAIDPEHEDSRYYLANCLAALGEGEAALAELAVLVEHNPESHRGHKQIGLLLALGARDDGDLARAERSLERAVEINPEETGGLLALGEVALLRGEVAAARQNLEFACRTNPKAVGGFYLRAFIAWRDGRAPESADLLRQARAARGEDWKPEGAAAEGDVAVRHHREESPLARFWRQWDGGTEPATAFTDLDRRLAAGGPGADPSPVG
jgi:enediyne biosynthesis protein E4